MSQINFKVSLSPSEVFHQLQVHQTADLVHEELFDVGEGRFVGTMIFEKYYFRASNRAALIVMVDNLKGQTEVRSVATGSSQGMIFNFDWGAANDFAHSVESILKDYILSE